MNKLGTVISAVMARHPKLEYNDVADIVKAARLEERSAITRYIDRRVGEHATKGIIAMMIDEGMHLKNG